MNEYTEIDAIADAAASAARSDLRPDVEDVVTTLREYVAKPSNQDDGMAHFVLDKLERALRGDTKATRPEDSE